MTDTNDKQMYGDKLLALRGSYGKQVENECIISKCNSLNAHVRHHLQAETVQLYA